MPLWRYKAVALDGPARGVVQSGEMSGEDDAEIRASLRRIGLQVLQIKAKRTTDWGSKHALVQSFADRVHDYFRRRRRAVVSEFYDSLATMLESGLPLLESLRTIDRTAERRGRSGRGVRSMVMLVRDQVSSGSGLSEAMAPSQGWFDAVDVAMIRAGEHAGDLSNVLRRLAERHERSESLNQKLVGALVYPAIVACVGLVVVIFLSVKTLPDLVTILRNAEVETPALTSSVMAVGQFAASYWFLSLGLVAVVLLACIALARICQQHPQLRAAVDRVTDRLTPDVYRRLALARAAQRLAELTRSGVPMTDALRIIGPTAPRMLRRELEQAAAAVERGDDLPTALAHDRWFDPEFKQLLAIGQTTGELHELLERIARRYTRQAERLIDRLAALLEPAVILLLAFLIGVVVMAAILPLVQLQEVL